MLTLIGSIWESVTKQPHYKLIFSLVLYKIIDSSNIIHRQTKTQPDRQKHPNKHMPQRFIYEKEVDWPQLHTCWSIYTLSGQYNDG